MMWCEHKFEGEIQRDGSDQICRWDAVVKLVLACGDCPTFDEIDERGFEVENIRDEKIFIAYDQDSASDTDTKYWDAKIEREVRQQINDSDASDYDWQEVEREYEHEDS